MKKITALMLVLILAMALLAGCGGSSGGSSAPAEPEGKARTAGSSQAENALNIGLTNAANTFDPHLFALQVEDAVILQTYEPLLLTMNDGTLADILTESHTVNEDGSVDFVLKEGVKFHSGDTLCAEDVEYTLSRIENSALLAPVYGMIEMEIQDDLHFTWKFPYADQGASFEALTPYLDGLEIVNKSWMEERLAVPTDKLGLEEDGTGAYYLDSVADNGDITLKRFEDYHGEASIDTINMKVITGDAEMAFESGDLDLTTYKKSTYDVVSQYTNVQAMSYPVNSVGMFINNCSEGKPTADLKVRQAIAYAIDREEIARTASDDGGETAYVMASPMVTYWADVADHFDQDVEKSKELMTEAGYSDANRAPLTIIALGTQTEWVSACEIMKEQLEQSYFTVTIDQVTGTDRYFTGDFDLGILAVGLTSNYVSYKGLFTDLNISFYTGQDVMDAFDAIKDEASTQEAMKVVTETLAYMPVYYPYAYYIFDDQLNVGEMNSATSAFFFREFSWK
ncbi:MAG: ABC transporter substrate-binding protein [Firmicutes bacterium]|nr:ABC transporter substrate-binding protein [Bacillota bacterium]